MEAHFWAFSLAIRIFAQKFMYPIAGRYILDIFGPRYGPQHLACLYGLDMYLSFSLLQ